MKKYSFKEITSCEMCQDDTKNHEILGQRLNKSQGFNPKNKIGISVSIQKCKRCGLIYSNPQPIPFDLQAHYGSPPQEYWEKERFIWNSEYFNSQIKEAKSLINFQKGMKALDVGAGLGKAMISMDKAEFDVYGLEPSIPFYNYAVSNLGLKAQKLKLGQVEDLIYEREYFDFITFGAVFEHLYEPSKCLEKALSWLKPNGIIHLEVPSSKWLLSKLINFYFKLAGTNYVTNLSPIHNPFHLFEFDIKSFEELSKYQNFKIAKYHYDVCSLYRIPKYFHWFFRKYMEATDTGMQLTLYLRKPNNVN